MHDLVAAADVEQGTVRDLVHGVRGAAPSWRSAERWTVGGFYRFASEFEMRRQVIAGPPAAPDFPASSAFTFTLHVPDAFGLGVAWRSGTERLTLSAEWDHVSYSQFIGAASTTEAVTDVDELHLGGELTFPRSTPVVALKLGVWLDPDHRMRAINAGPLFEAILQPGADQIHYAAGVGLAFESFQVDLGVDLSDPVDTVSASAVDSF